MENYLHQHLVSSVCRNVNLSGTMYFHPTEIQLQRPKTASSVTRNETLALAMLVSPSPF